jgi:hypothetical protein
MISLEPMPPDQPATATKPKRTLSAGLLAYQARKRAEKERAKAPKTSRVPAKAPKPRKARKGTKKSVQRSAPTTPTAKQSASKRLTATNNRRFYL